MYNTNKFCHLCSARLFSRVWTSQSAACMCVLHHQRRRRRGTDFTSARSPPQYCVCILIRYFSMDDLMWRFEDGRTSKTPTPPQLPSWVSSQAADVAEQREQKVPVVFPSAALDWMPPATGVSHHLHCCPAWIFIYILSRRVQVPTGRRRLWPCGL